MRTNFILNENECLVVLINNFIETTVGDVVFRELEDTLSWTRVGKRLCMWFGDCPYTYGAVTHPINNDWPISLVQIKAKINGLFGASTNAVLCNYYHGVS